MLHDPGGLATKDPVIQKLDNYYSDSNNTSSSSSSSVPPFSKVPRTPSERKSTTNTTMTNGIHNHRRSSDRTKDLHRLNAPQLIDLVLQLESQLDKTDTRLKKYVLKCKEHVESESQAAQQANKFRQKMTQVILDAQQEAARAKQDVEEYKLRFENVQKELQRSREVVQILENDKDEIQRALHRARDRAREYKERSAVQLAREEGRRAGFEQGLEQGRLAIQIAHVRSVLPALTNTTPRTAPRRRALTQGTDGATTPSTRPRRRHSHQPRTDSFPSQHGRRSSLDSVQEEPTSRSRSRPPSQAQTDGGRSNASGHERREQRSNTGPAPPAQQFPAGVPPDNVSEATTSPASTMTGMDILTFRDAPVVSTSSPEARRPRGGRANTNTGEDDIRAPTSHPPVSGPPPTVPQQTSHPTSSRPEITVEPPPMPPPMQQQQQPPPVVFPPDENLLTPTFLPSHTLPRSTSSNSIPHSTRSSLSFDINVVSPSPPSTPQESEEMSSGQNDSFLSPLGSRPMSLPRTQPQPHETPVLPVLPRIVSRPTAIGTPDIRPLDFSGGNYYNTDVPAGAGYEEADTPPGFEYPLPLGAAISGSQNVISGKGKEKSGSSSSSSYYGATSSQQQPVVPPVAPRTSSLSSSSTSSLSQQPVIPPVTPKTSSSLSSSSTSSSQQPVVPPVTPNVGIYQQQQGSGNGYYRNRGSDDEEEDTSFDSATKRNTQLNSRLYRQGKWGE